ncbi:DNA mismatch repair protein MutS [Pseudoduganella sp. FT93W]|uniref:DNA mismatch repair protein MutS n=1 Tax=Duganella fentianensis TaxID=2692177 RepID=A0A845I3M7_9BURK|nr:DNA mismatch repair protein MutS [Duganella fentianensis]MYN46525.1 DNA mismatch repair protein MutS [Duganella fentianensis]
MRLLEKLSRLLLPASQAAIDYPFAASDVAQYRHSAHPEDSVLDEQTWNDLLLAKYSGLLTRGTSIFGQQELHRRLHSGNGATMDSMARVRALLDDPAQESLLLQACTGLRQADCEVSATLWQNAMRDAPRWSRLLPGLPLGLLATVVLALASAWPAVWLLVLGFWLALLAVQMRYHEPMQSWTRQRAALQQLLRSHTLLGGLDQPLARDWQTDAAEAARLNRLLAPSPLASLPGVAEYQDWLWLANVRHYFASRAVVKAHLPWLRDCFARMAALEADLALVCHLRRQPRYCWAEQGDGVALVQVAHPLLEQPQTLDVQLAHKGAFISGQNGIGKSTLLRTVGLNLLTARAFGFCYAAQASVVRLPVYASMQSEDALDQGESLYLAELRRARELLARAEQGRAVFIIDEIFRGTNHLESISAAAAVLQRLAAQALVIVSSHNLVLAPLLQRELEPWCVRRHQQQLRLMPGVLAETNGIALLDAQGFDGAIARRARQVYDWLSAYMAHPGEQELLLLL